MATAIALKELVLTAVDDRKGVEPVALDVAALTEVTDYMVICSGSSNRHVKAIVDNVLDAVKARGIAVLGIEGRASSDWVLIDLADVVVHVMRAETRAFYDLERLWETPAEASPPSAGNAVRTPWPGATASAQGALGNRNAGANA